MWILNHRLTKASLQTNEVNTLYGRDIENEYRLTNSNRNSKLTMGSELVIY